MSFRNLYISASLPIIRVSAIIVLTTPTILTLNDKIHMILSHTAVFRIAFANVSTAIAISCVVENEDIATILSERWKLIKFFLPFVLKMI